jgi:hypothetical protein
MSFSPCRPLPALLPAAPTASQSRLELFKKIVLVTASVSLV